MPPLGFWDRVTWGPVLITFFDGKNYVYCVGNKSIHLFTFERAILSALEPYAAFSASTRSWPSLLHGFGLCKHDLAWVHVVTRVMQRSHRWFFIYGFIFVSVLFQGVCGLVWPFFFALTWRVGDFNWTVWFFILANLLYPASGIFPRQSCWVCRTPQDLWGLWWKILTIRSLVFFATSLEVRTPPTQGSGLLVGVVLPQREGNSRGTLPYHLCHRWNIGSWCLLEMKRLGRKELGDGVLHHQLIVELFHPQMGQFI